MEHSSEIVASFRLTPELWYQGSRLLLQRQHRWFSAQVVWPVTLGMLVLLGWLDFSPWFDDGLMPALILLNAVGLLACTALWLTPVLIRRKLNTAYRRLPEQNRQVIWRFSPFGVSAEGGMIRFEGNWDDLREIVETPELFLIFRKEKSASVIPVTAFADAEAVEDFVFVAKTRAPKFVDLSTGFEEPGRRERDIGNPR